MTDQAAISVPSVALADFCTIYPNILHDLSQHTDSARARIEGPYTIKK